MTPSQPRIAVLIPAHNAKKSIEKTIASLNSNSEPHDIVIVDDGSTPPLSSWYQPQANTKIIRSAQNVGITKALNVGLAYIFERGYDYIARIDLDDFVVPERLYKQREFLDNNIDVGFVGSWTKYVSQEGAEAFYFHAPTDHNGIVRKLNYNSCSSHPSLMFRSSALRQVEGYDERCLVGQDYELLRRMAACFRAANIPEYLVECTMTTDGISIKKRRKQLISRLNTQWRYRNWLSIHFYLGVIKTLALLLVPRTIVTTIKSIKKDYKEKQRTG